MKIEEIKYINIDGGNDDQIIDKLNVLIKAHNEREEKCNHSENMSCLKCATDKPLSHFFKPESELIQSYIKEREILLKHLEYCFEYPSSEANNIKTLQQRLQEIDRLILK